MSKQFGTDGIRGKAEKFTTNFLAGIVCGLAKYNKSLNRESFKVLIGGDTRESSEWILQDLESALETFGAEFGNVEVLPTPAINYVFYQMGFDYAIDVTASHNPYTDNGIKIFERGENSGIKLSANGREYIENELALNQTYDLVSAELRESLHEDAVELYGTHLKEYVGDTKLAGIKIGIDCANGATSTLSGRLFEELGATVVSINADATYGTKINNNCGSTHLEQLTDLVTKERLDFGAAFDGDGDRCLLIDNTGAIVDGDNILAILAEYLKLGGLVATVMANQGLMEWAKEHATKLEVSDVGDQNVAAKMREQDIRLGGEQSGHIILPNESMGDGMLTALMMAKIVTEKSVSLEDLAKGMQKFPQITKNIPATNTEKTNLQLPNAQNIIEKYTAIVAKNGGRILVRPSGTEELIRITLWGKDEQEINELATQLSSELQEEISK